MITIPAYVPTPGPTPLTCACTSHKASSVAGLDGFRA